MGMKKFDESQRLSKSTQVKTKHKKVGLGAYRARITNTEGHMIGITSNTPLT